jgi:hypothetical protein
MALSGCIFDMRNLLLLAGFSLLLSCQTDSGEIDLSTVNRNSEFARFDQAFFTTDTANLEREISELASEFPEFFTGGRNPVFWRAQRTDELQLELFNKSQKVFTEFDELNENLDFSMKHFYHFFPETPDIKFYTYISNLDFEYPILYADSVCFAALDLYLGPSQAYYQHLPQYIAFYRQPAFLIRDIIYELAKSKTPPLKPGGTLLDAMIYHGKLLYATKKIMPQSEEQLIMQYTPDEMGFCNQNERSMWAYFIENKYLFSTSQDLKNRFIELAPFSKFRMDFDQETPGMAGRWLGLQILKAYADRNQELTLSEILVEQDSRKILKLSGYKP